MSVYVVEWSDYFPHETKDRIALVPALLNGVYLLMGKWRENPIDKVSWMLMAVSVSDIVFFSGPISSALTNVFGFRKVIFSGAIFTAIAFFAAVFARDLNAIIGIFGVLGG